MLSNDSGSDLFSKESPWDWNAGIEKARSLHAELPFLYNADRWGWFEALSNNTRVDMTDRLRRQKIFLSLLDIELSHVQNLLEEKKIPLMVIKGADLARRVYARPELRPMADIDILVPRQLFETTIKQLLNAGYQSIHAEKTRGHRVELSRGHAMPVIELHSRLSTSDLDSKEIWKHSVPLEIAPHQIVQRLGDEDCLAYLIRHAGVQHLIESPLWLNDLHFLILKNSTMRWDRVLEKLRGTESIFAAWFLLEMLSQLWLTPVPEECLIEMGKSVPAWRKNLLKTYFGSMDWFNSTPRNFTWVVKNRFLLRDRAGKAMLYGVARALRGV